MVPVPATPVPHPVTSHPTPNRCGPAAPWQPPSIHTKMARFRESFILLGVGSTVCEPDFEKCELVPVIAQDDETGEVLMLAYMNRDAYHETLRTGRVCYYSRSRQKLWRKV